jgi:hypothetical protein
MRNEVNRKILVDLFGRPASFIPIVAGLSVLIVSWAAGSLGLAAAGFFSTIIGLGVFASRLIWGLDKIVAEAQQQVLQKTEEEKNKILDELEKKLKEDRDPRPEKCLQELRSLHTLLREASKSNNAWVGPVVDDFERLFEICVKQIKKTDDLWRSSRTMNGVAGKTLKKERERIVQEIEATTLQLTQTIEQFKVQTAKNGDDAELADAREELKRTIEVAKKVDQRLADLGKKDYDLKEFE